MNAQQYEPYFTAFTEPAKAWLEALRRALAVETGAAFTEIELVDRDVDQGFGFAAEGKPHLYVELMLVDGGERGFEGLGLICECSPRIAGQVWAPHNYTDEVGTADVPVLVDRLRYAGDDFAALARRIAAEWTNSEAEFEQAKGAPAPAAN